MLRLLPHPFTNTHTTDWNTMTKIRTLTTIVIETEEPGEVSSDILDALSKDMLKKGKKVGSKFAKWYIQDDEDVEVFVECTVNVGLIGE